MVIVGQPSPEIAAHMKDRILQNTRWKAFRKLMLTCAAAGDAAGVERHAAEAVEAFKRELEALATLQGLWRDEERRAIQTSEGVQ